jgi:NAD(P)-dependent dehydrogenase (short-subunit alcohol dehydrogenase family)
MSTGSGNAGMGKNMATLEGKVAVVTGATSGIGERIAELFVQEGAKVVAAGRREKEGMALQERLGDRLAFLRTDVAVEGDVMAMIGHAVQHFDGLDCLVNNAAIPSPMMSIVDTDLSNFDEVMAVNVRGVMLGMKYAAPVMLERGSGSIINISSLSALRAGWAAHSYCASKGAVTQLTKSVASELGEKAIRVNSISPGGIATGIFGKNAGVEGTEADQVLDVVKALFATLQPIPRSGMTDDIAQAAVFLASDVSSFINGHDLVVDGGNSIVGRGWSAGLDLRADLSRKLKARIAEL